DRAAHSRPIAARSLRLDADRGLAHVELPARPAQQRSTRCGFDAHRRSAHARHELQAWESKQPRNLRATCAARRATPQRERTCSLVEVRSTCAVEVESEA